MRKHRDAPAGEPWRSVRAIEPRAGFVEESALAVLTFLADVERSHRTVIAHDPSPYLAGLTLGVGQHDRPQHLDLGHIVHVHPPLLCQAQAAASSLRGLLASLPRFETYRVCRSRDSRTLDPRSLRERVDWRLAARTALPGDQVVVALRAKLVFAFEIAVLGADREGRGHGDIRQAEARKRALHQLPARRSRRDALAHVQVQHGPSRVLFLQLFLAFQRFERVVGEPDRQLKKYTGGT